MLYANLSDNDNDRYSMDQKQKQLESRALALAAAWSDFDVVEESAKEVVRRFGAIEPRDLGIMRLHKHPLFVSLQAACVIGYTRPFANGLELISAECSKYSKREWQELHEDLFVWRTCLTGYSSSRQFVVARDVEGKQTSHRYVIAEASPVLEPLTDFAALRDMCADRKAILWPQLEDAVSECYPAFYHPVLLSLGGAADLLDS